MSKPLVIQEISKSFDNKKAVDRLNLDVERGEIFVLLGPNGAGKTTTIKLISGILSPDCGKIFVAGYNLHEQPEKAKAMIGLIPDSPFIYENLSGHEFIHFVGKLRGMDRDLIEKDLGRLDSYLEFGSWFDTKSGGYSHGMKQRVMIAQAMIHHPKLILIDEPMVGLDPRAMLKVIDLLMSVKEETGIFISTHLIPLAEKLADRLCIIDLGQIGYLGKRSDFSGRIEEIFLSVTHE